MSDIADGVCIITHMCIVTQQIVIKRILRNTFVNRIQWQKIQFYDKSHPNLTLLAWFFGVHSLPSEPLISVTMKCVCVPQIIISAMAWHTLRIRGQPKRKAWLWPARDTDFNEVHLF